MSKNISNNKIFEIFNNQGNLLRNIILSTLPLVQSKFLNLSVQWIKMFSKLIPFLNKLKL